MKMPFLTVESSLGKQTDYVSTYTPTLLFPIARKLARESIGLQDSLPFHGVDLWTAYEISWLNSKGKPEVAIADFYIPYNTENLIESKSFKLYLNSFNQTHFDSMEEVQALLEKDLSQAAKGHVGVKLIPSSLFNFQRIDSFPGTCLDDLDISTDTYNVEPNFLQAGNETVFETYYTHLLKSNCLVTGQPDWATVLIRYEGRRIDPAGLLKYLISFRNHQGFHEQCVEKMFWDLTERCEPKKLTVYARYTRRGGLDINPFRSNFEMDPENIRLAQQ